MRITLTIEIDSQDGKPAEVKIKTQQVQSISPQSILPEPINSPVIKSGAMLKCIVCGSEFAGKKNHIYCSDQCRESDKKRKKAESNARYKLKKKPEPIEKTLAECEKSQHEPYVFGK